MDSEQRMTDALMNTYRDAARPRRCALCGVRTRYIGSHVLREHVTYGAGLDANLAALAAERAARAARGAR